MPRPKLEISTSLANTIRKKLDITARQLGYEAKKLGITVNQLYRAKYETYKQLKANAKWQTKNKNKKGKPIKEVDFLKQIALDAHVPYVERRLELNDRKKFFVNVSFSTNSKYGGDNRVYPENLNRIYTIDSTRNNLYSQVIERLQQDYDIADSGKITWFDKAKRVTMNIQKEEAFNAPTDIRHIPVRRCGVLKYDFMPEIAEISFKTTEMKCVLQTLVHRYTNWRRSIPEARIISEFK